MSRHSKDVAADTVASYVIYRCQYFGECDIPSVTDEDNVPEFFVAQLSIAKIKDVERILIRWAER